MAIGLQRALTAVSILTGLIGLCLLSGPDAGAQGGRVNADIGGSQTAGQGRGQAGRTLPDGANPAPESAGGADRNGDGPVRLARIAYTGGNVTWRADDQGSWSAATTNLPLREGAQLWVQDGGRTEVQFDDGSILRLGNGAVVTLQTLYSDAEGEFTEIKLTAGLASLNLRNNISVYQVDTPLASIKAAGPAKFRLGVDTGLEVAVKLGGVVVESQQGKTDLAAGNYLDLRDAQSTYQIESLPGKDSWDLWNDERDEAIEGAARPAVKYLPPDIALVAGDIDDYGSWHDDPTYGQVWCPSVSDPDWRPYHDGHWTWGAPFGWTWVAAEPWGWAPYHYGTWVYLPHGWAWAPGPAQQVWCPAVVHFSRYHGQIAWCPLAPTEVRYPPALGIRFHHGNWATLFSIGQAGVYYAGDRTYCVSRPFSTTVVNRVRPAALVGTGAPGSNGAPVSTAPAARPRFVPINAVRAAGGSVATAAEFTGGERYRTLPKSSGAYFAEGTSTDASASTNAPVSGPLSVPPTLGAMTPTRVYFPNTMPAAAILHRTVIAAPLPPRVQRTAATAATGQPTANAGVRPATAARPGIVTLRPDRPAVAGAPPAQGTRTASRTDGSAAQRAAGARSSLGASNSQTANRGAIGTTDRGAAGNSGTGSSAPGPSPGSSGRTNNGPPQPKPEAPRQEQPRPNPPRQEAPRSEPQRPSPPPERHDDKSTGTTGRRG